MALPAEGARWRRRPAGSTTSRGAAGQDAQVRGCTLASNAETTAQAPGEEVIVWVRMTSSASKGRVSPGGDQSGLLLSLQRPVEERRSGLSGAPTGTPGRFVRLDQELGPTEQRRLFPPNSGVMPAAGHERSGRLLTARGQRSVQHGLRLGPLAIGVEQQLVGPDGDLLGLLEDVLDRGILRPSRDQPAGQSLRQVVAIVAAAGQAVPPAREEDRADSERVAAARPQTQNSPHIW